MRLNSHLMNIFYLTLQKNLNIHWGFSFVSVLSFYLIKLCYINTEYKVYEL